MSQKIGPITGSRNIKIDQISDGHTSQTVDGVWSSENVALRQMALEAEGIIDIASELANTVGRLDSVPLKELSAIVQEAIGNTSIQHVDVVKAQGILSASTSQSQILKDSLTALASACSIVSGGITVAALGSPLAIAVSLPLTVALAGLCDLSVVSRLLARVRKKIGV